jgi:putative endonuclease
MNKVYILQSLNDSSKRYIGFTSKPLALRLERHNEGLSPSTSRYNPWEIIWSCEFQDKEMALDFERYLKSGSGRAFAAKRLIPRPPKPQP